MKVVIAGSAKDQEAMLRWKTYWEENHEVIAWPEPITKEPFALSYKQVFTDFYQAITEADLLFVANEPKGEIAGYIGSAVFAEIAFAVAQKALDQKNISIILAHPPGVEVRGYEEIMLWKELGWVQIREHSP